MRIVHTKSALHRRALQVLDNLRPCSGHAVSLSLTQLWIARTRATEQLTAQINHGADYTAILVPTTAVKVPITTMLREAKVAGFESNDLLGPLTQADGSDHLWFVGC